MTTTQILSEVNRLFEAAPSQSAERSAWWTVKRLIGPLTEFNRISTYRYLQHSCLPHASGALAVALQKVMALFESERAIGKE